MNGLFFDELDGLLDSHLPHIPVLSLVCLLELSYHILVLLFDDGLVGHGVLEVLVLGFDEPSQLCEELFVFIIALG